MSSTAALCMLVPLPARRCHPSATTYARRALPPVAWHFSNTVHHACLGHLAVPRSPDMLPWASAPLIVVTDSSTSPQLALLLPTQPPVVLAAFCLPARTAGAAPALVLLTGPGTRPFASQETQVVKRLVHWPAASPLHPPCSTRCCLDGF